MEEVNIKTEMEDPKESPDVGACRFCEALGEHSNMMEETSDRENYPNMLLECFNIFLSTDDSASWLICVTCAGRLRDARDFKQLVLRAQCGLGVRCAVAGTEASQICHVGAVKEETIEPESIEPDPDDIVVKCEPQDSIDIVEHELPTTPDDSGDRDNSWTERIVYGVADPNIYAGDPKNVQKFLEEYYSGQDDEEESNSCYEMPDDKDVVEMYEENLFLETGCGCKLACTDMFDRNDILKSRLDCLEQDYYCYQNINHLALIVLGAFNATVLQTNTRTTDMSKHIPKSRHRAHVGYWFRGFLVCKKFFLFVHGLNAKKYEKILKCFKENGVEAVSHGNKKSLMTKQQRNDVVTFLTNFSEQNSLVLPGRSPDGTDLHILPSSMTRTSIYELYVRACHQDNRYPVSRPLWYRAWDNFCPNITVKLSDHCRTCKDLISDLSRQPDDIKKKKCSNKALDHLNFVQAQRAYYQSVIAQVGSLGMEASLCHHIPCSYDGLVHYSFDYFQDIHLPHYHDQIGPLNFLNGYKVSLFGVAVETLQKFVLYVIPEYVTKGINLVVSLLDHFFNTYALGETHVVCHAVDNQIKNGTLIQYALWRVMSGLHKSVQLSFLPSGHTKFTPDLYFGMIKSKFRESDVNSLMDVCQVAASSNISGGAVLVADETGKCSVNTYDWKKFFSEYLPASIPNLHSFAHFKTDSLHSGSVLCSTSPNDNPDPIQVFNSTFTNFPAIIEPQPLSIERQEYLYENLRKFVPSKYQDLLCPIPVSFNNSAADAEQCNVKEESSDNDLPTGLDSSVLDCKVIDVSSDNSSLVESFEVKTEEPVLNEVKDEQSESDHVETIQVKRKIGTCSYCGDTGHRNRVKRGKYVCKKRQLAKEALAEIAATEAAIDTIDIKRCGHCVTIELDSSTDNSGNESCSGHNPNNSRPNSNAENDNAMHQSEQDEGKVEETSVKVSKPRKRPVCSYCGVEGHRNLIKNGFYICQKRWLDRAASVSSIVKM